MALTREMKLLFRLTFLTLFLVTEVYTQQRPSTDFILSSCRRSFVQLDLPAQYVLKKFVRFSAIDPTGAAYVITDDLAIKCGYTITYDAWGNISFRASLYSCYANIGTVHQFDVGVKIEVASRRDMTDAVNYMKVVSCPYVMNPREIICEANYMEVSVRRKIPIISEGVFRNEPEDWSTAFTQAVSGLMSVWQVVFHISTTQKTTMLIDAAQNIGYGINTTESRTLLRTSYNASHAVPQRISGVTFSTVRATLFYKQRWFIYLVDNAVACPVDDVKFTSGWIVWTIPKSVSPLLTGAKGIQNRRIQFGVDLQNLTNVDILSRGVEILDSNTVTTARIPVGALGGYYKSRVVNFQYGRTYSIQPFIENVWTDDGWGVTKYTIIKDITTPFEERPPVITNETVPSTLIFNVTVGTFLPDVQLIYFTVGNTTSMVPQGVDSGFILGNKTLPNGDVIFILKVPFINQNVYKKHLPDGILFTLNVTFGFKIIPYDETFTTTETVECFIRQPNVGPCWQKGGMLTTTLGNLDPSWSINIKGTPATSSSGMLSVINQTHAEIQVPAASNLAMDEVTIKGLTTTIPLSITDQNGNNLYTFLISCESSPQTAVCLPDGTIQVSVKEISNIPEMKLSELTLRDKRCGPVTTNGGTAQFSFTVNSCATTRRFEGNIMIYDNEISYLSSVSGKVLYRMPVSCKYSTNGTLVIDYTPRNNPEPSAQNGSASLDLVLRLSKDDAYNVFYEDAEYPVVKYLREPLYFEVELLHRSDPQLELFLDSCWATTTPDMRSLPMWPIVDNSCEHNEPYQTIFHQVRADSRVQIPSHLKRFEVKTLTFMGEGAIYGGEIYFHCEVIICDSSNPTSDPACAQVGSCIPARQRLGRSVDADDEHKLVSSKAVFLLEVKSRVDTKQFQKHPQRSDVHF
ncbi:uncharacterized protein [Engystomops pustulosus]|uniref:uncharacterized protein n=1 Tax=Engystomops pustulosus TaxID=76066 RepID=UPI003AFA2D5C